MGRTFICDEGVTGFNLTSDKLCFGKGLTFAGPVVVDWDQDLQFGANVLPANYRSYFIAPALRANAFAPTGVALGQFLVAGYGTLTRVRNWNLAGTHER